MTNDMNDILMMVRSGKLQQATSAIQAGLHRSAASTETDARSGQGPMKDVTPTVAALAGPMPRADGRSPSTRPDRNAAKPGETRTEKSGTSRWLRRDGVVPYRVYVPAVPVADAPLIVMLHGCTQNPEDFATGTDMNAAAERIGAHVVWPEQVRSANMNGCWNWFEPVHQGRGGEAAAIAALTQSAAREFAPQARGVHVAGLSAGGAMAAILGASYPEVFSSIAVHSGLPVGSARDMASAFAAMQSGGTANTQIRLPVIVFHGTADRTVSPANGKAVAGAVRDASKPRRRSMEIDGRGVTVTRSDQSDGRPAAELWEVQGLGHAWSGGSASGSYADPRGPNATEQILRFFDEVDRGQ